MRSEADDQSCTLCGARPADHATYPASGVELFWCDDDCPECNAPAPRPIPHQHLPERITS